MHETNVSLPDRYCGGVARCLSQPEAMSGLEIRMHNKRKFAPAVIAALALLMGVLSGCASSSDNSDTYAGIAAHQEVPGQQCFEQMDTDQVVQMQQVAANNHDDVNVGSENSDGTQTVCVLERTSNGGYEQHYYDQNDGFENYLLYSMMLGRSNALVSYGLLSGNLSVGDAMALSLLTSVGSNGRVYHEYSNTGGSWQRKQTVVNNYHVTNVQYGHARPMTLAKAKTVAPPAGYSRPTTPKVTKTEAKVTKTGALKPVKKVASSNTYKNPSSPSGSSTKSPSSTKTKSSCGFFGCGSSSKSKSTGGGTTYKSRSKR
jgi:hypothetical protein